MQVFILLLKLSMTPKLTIAIPTLNPKIDFLNDALLSIVGSAAGHKEQLEILVVSNGSSRTSEYEIKHLENIFVDFRFVYELENLGYDRNVDRLFEHAFGEYVWIFGDDDLMFVDSISKMLSALESNNCPSFVLSRPIFFSEQLPNLSINRNISVNHIDLEGIKGFSEMGFLPAAVSTVCINKKAWKQVNTDFSYGSNWIHFLKIEQLLSIDIFNKGILVDSDLVAIRRADSSRWESHFGSQFSSGLTLLEISNLGMNHGINHEIVSWIYNQRFKTNFLDLLWLFRPKNLHEKTEMYNRQKQLFSGEIRFWLVDVLAIYMPNFSRTFIVYLLSRVKNLINQ